MSDGVRVEGNVIEFPTGKPIDAATIELVLGYIARGWNPVPVPYRTKGPQGKDWDKRRVDVNNAAQYFPPNQSWNIGIQLGPMFGNLVDLDLDCPEALLVWSTFFPPTQAVFGRASKSYSHGLYYSKDLIESAKKATIQFLDPEVHDKKRATLLEVRCGGGGKGAQTVFPGSVHPSGEAIQWHVHGEPARVAGDTLLMAAKWTAATCLLVRAWPGEAARHNAALALGGFLARIGMAVEKSEQLIRIIAEAAGDDEIEDRAKCAVAPSADRPLPGLPKMAEAFGEKRAKKIAEWLGYREAKANRALGVEDVETPSAETLNIIDRLNKEWCVVIDGARTRVMRFVENEINHQQRRIAEFLSFTDFRNFYLNEKIRISNGPNLPDTQTPEKIAKIELSW